MAKVYLAEHLGLAQLRAIKRIRKQGLSLKQLHREAMILKQLRHPSIPIVYDLEEDSQYIYIIEEFIGGESLYTLVTRLGYLTRAKVISYGIQICRLIHFLHSAEPNPILYLDLQPKNLLLCHNMLKLVDFDQALFLPQAERKGKRYGTVGCAAPEQYTQEPLDQRTDIYAIGALLYYMGTGQFLCDGHWKAPDSWDRELTAIVYKCLQYDRQNRYATVLQVLEALQRLQTGVFRQEMTSALMIAFVGSKPGCGVTHTALGFCAYLTDLGIPCIYREQNPSAAVSQMVRDAKMVPDRHGIYSFSGCGLMPDYESWVELDPFQAFVVLLDYGTDWFRASREPDISQIWLVGGVSPWEKEKTLEAITYLSQDQRVGLLLHHLPDQKRLHLPGQRKDLPAYRLPFFADPFHLEKKARAFYQVVWQTAEVYNHGGKGFWEKLLFGLRKRSSIPPG